MRGLEPNLNYIKKLMSERGWSGSELSRQMGISRSETNRFLNGKRDGGKKVINGLLRAFPEERLDQLFFLPSLSPNVNICENSVAYKNTWQIAKHPKGTGISCRYNEAAGLVEIEKGNAKTELHVPPGPIRPEYKSKK